MNQGIPWLSGVDRVMLDFYERHDIIISPALLLSNLEHDLGEDIAPSDSQIRRRLRVLVDAGLVEKVDTGKYRLTDLGRKAANRELDDDEREALGVLEPTWRPTDE